MIFLAAYSGLYRPQEEPGAADGIVSHREQNDEQRRDKHHQENAPFSFQGLWRKIEAVGMESDDLLLALVLFLMYRESGDKDLLILLGAMLLS